MFASTRFFIYRNAGFSFQTKSTVEHNHRSSLYSVFSPYCFAPGQPMISNTDEECVMIGSSMDGDGTCGHLWTVENCYDKKVPGT